MAVTNAISAIVTGAMLAAAMTQTTLGKPGVGGGAGGGQRLVVTRVACWKCLGKDKPAKAAAGDKA
jgi:hypothetical protein